MAFTYQRPKPEDLEKRAAGSTDFQGIIKPEFKVWSPEKGDNGIRIFPGTWENPRSYGYDTWVHYGIGPNNTTVLCLAKNKNQKCPICDARMRGDSPATEEGKKDPLMPTRRVSVWLMDVKNPDKGPMIYAMPWTMDRDITQICKDRETGEWYYIDDPSAGYNVYFNKVEKGGDKRFTEYTGYSLSKRPSAVDPDMMEYVAQHPLPTCFAWMSYDAILALYEGVTEDDVKARGHQSSDQANTTTPKERKWGNPTKTAASSPTTEPPEDRWGPADGGYKDPEPDEPVTTKPSGKPNLNRGGGAAEAPKENPTQAAASAEAGGSIADRLKAKFAARNVGK